MLCTALLSTAILKGDITLQIPASSVAEVLSIVSTQTGKELVAKGSVANDRIALFVNNQPEQSVLDQVAAAVGAKWTEDNGTLILERTSAMEQAEAAAATKEWADETRKRIKDEIKAFTNNGEFNEARAKEHAEAASQPIHGEINDETRERLEKLSKSSPTNLAVLEAIELIDLGQLAQLPAGSRTVYSSHPTQVQRNLGRNSLQIARTAVSREKMIQGYQKPGDENQHETFVEGSFSFSIGGKNLTGTPSTVLLVCQKSSDREVSVQLKIFNVEGQLMLSGFHHLGTFPVSASELGAKIEPEPIQFSPDSIHLLKVINAGIAGGQVAVMQYAMFLDNKLMTIRLGPDTDDNIPTTPENLRSKLLDPVKIDPLSYFVGDGIKALSSASKLNVVACLNDPMFSTLGIGLDPSRANAQEFAKRLTQGGFKITQDGTWMRIRPTDPISGRNRQIDRRALARLLGTADKTGYPDLDSQADYAKTAPIQCATFDLDYLYTRMIAPGFAVAARNELFGSGRELYKFYGSLGANQRTLLHQEGGVINMTAMSPASKSSLERLTYWSSGSDIDGLELDLPDRKGKPAILEEITVALPNGLPRFGTVSLNRDAQPAAIGRTKDGHEKYMSPSAYAQYQLGIDGKLPNLPGAGSQADQIQYTEFKDAVYTSYNFKFVFSDELMRTRLMTDYRSNATKRFGNLDQLSSEFLTKAKEEYDTLYKIFGNVRFGDDGGSQRP